MSLIYKYQTGNRVKVNKLLSDYDKELSVIKSKADKFNSKGDDFWSLGSKQISDLKSNKKLSAKDYEVKAKLLVDNINKLRNK